MAQGKTARPSPKKASISPPSSPVIPATVAPTPSKESASTLALKREYAESLEKKARMMECLPHLYGFKWYKWAWELFVSVAPLNFLVAANQISKSSTLIRIFIDRATDKSKWPKLWKTTPTQFWYFYPSRDTATREFEEKWVKEFLPREEYKEDAVYGWRAVYNGKFISSLVFNSGVTIYFMSYEQDIMNLQASSVYMIGCDEEMPAEAWSEVQLRLQSVDGYFFTVFTATRGQRFFMEIMEHQAIGVKERFPDAAKWHVSMYDCVTYMDGSPSPWTLEKIKRVEETLCSESEIARRVFGRFVIENNELLFPGFLRSRNLVEDHGLPASWEIYSGTDIGSGGATGHPAAMVFVSVSPDYTRGRVFKSRRMDGIPTESRDILEEFRLQRGDMHVMAQAYDWQSKDFFLVAERAGETFVPADKRQDFGEGLLNTLFKTGMLLIFENDENMKMVVELENVKKSTPKPKRKDDLADALRFAVAQIPWDFEKAWADPTICKQRQVKAKGRTMDDCLKTYRGMENDIGEETGLDMFVEEINEANDWYEN